MLAQTVRRTAPFLGHSPLSYMMMRSSRSYLRASKKMCIGGGSRNGEQKKKEKKKRQSH
jgi:hypothetical protein